MSKNRIDAFQDAFGPPSLGGGTPGDGSPGGSVGAIQYKINSTTFGGFGSYDSSTGDVTLPGALGFASGFNSIRVLGTTAGGQVRNSPAPGGSEEFLQNFDGGWASVPQVKYINNTGVFSVNTNFQVDTNGNGIFSGGTSLNVFGEGGDGGITLANNGHYGTVQMDSSGNYNFAMGSGSAMRFLNASTYEYDNDVYLLAGAALRIFNASGLNFSSLTNDTDGNLNFTGTTGSYIFDHRIVAPSIYNPVSGAAFIDVTNAKIYDQAASPIQFIDAANRLFYDPAGQNTLDLSAFLRIGIKGGSFLDFFNVANNHSFSITNNGASGGSILAMDGAASYRYDAPIWVPQLNTAAGTPMIILNSGGALTNGYSAAVGHFDVYDPTDTDYASWSSAIVGPLLISYHTRAAQYHFDGPVIAPTSISSKTDTVLSPYEVLTSDQSAHFNNSGALAEVGLALPAAAPGLTYTATDINGNNIRFIADGTDTIRIAALVSAAGGYAQIIGNGSSLTLTCHTAGEWHAESSVGTTGVL